MFSLVDWPQHFASNQTESPSRGQESQGPTSSEWSIGEPLIRLIVTPTIVGSQ